jgi:four helix bundle protein
MSLANIERTRAMQARCLEFAAMCVLATRKFPKAPEAWVVRAQLTRSSTSVGANYRAAGCAMSSRGFIAKLSIALEEADESTYWLHLCLRLGLLNREDVDPVLKEGGNSSESSRRAAAPHAPARSPEKKVVNQELPDREVQMARWLVGQIARWPFPRTGS